MHQILGPSDSQRRKCRATRVHQCLLLTFLKTTWGSRDGADTDNRVRMIRLPRYGSPDPEGRKSETFEFTDELLLKQEYLPAYESHSKHSRLPLTTRFND